MDDMISCPVCKGSKVNPYGGRGTCQCCKGVGEITQTHMDALKRISADLKAKMEEKKLDIIL